MNGALRNSTLASNTQYSAINTGICTTIGKQPPSGLIFSVLYISIIACCMRCRSSPYCSLTFCIFGRSKRSELFLLLRSGVQAHVYSPRGARRDAVRRHDDARSVQAVSQHPRIELARSFAGREPRRHEIMLHESDPPIVDVPRIVSLALVDVAEGHFAELRLVRVHGRASVRRHHLRIAG